MAIDQRVYLDTSLLQPPNQPQQTAAGLRHCGLGPAALRMATRMSMSDKPVKASKSRIAWLVAGWPRVVAEG